MITEERQKEVKGKKIGAETESKESRKVGESR